MIWRMLICTLLLAGAAFAVEPDEILDDPLLESRAREISQGLRCLVCRNESIDASNADLAKDLRVLVRERLVAGDTDQQIVEYVVERYGEYVLLKPTWRSNWALWLAGPFIFLVALGVGIWFVRSRSTQPPVQAEGLTDQEKADLEKLMQD